MNMTEFALLFAVSIPVMTIVGMQVFLYASGERGTGLIPGLASYPSIDIKAMEPARQSMVSEIPTIEITVRSSNDEEERLAA